MKYLLSFIFSILILACSDNTPNSKLLQVEPFNINFSSALAPGATLNVPVNSKLILEPTEALNPETVNDTNIYIEDSAHNRHESEVSLTAHNIIIKPILYLTPSTAYNIIVSTEVTDTKGQALSKPLEIPFVSGPSIDDIGPILVGTLPQDIPYSSTQEFGVIYYQFNETLAPLLPDTSLIKLYYNDDNTTVNGTIQHSGALLSFKPSDLLMGDPTYRIELNTTHIKDLAGNSFNGNIIKSFIFKANESPSVELNTSIVETITPYDTHHVINCIETIDDYLFVGTQNNLQILEYNNSAQKFESVADLVIANGAAIYDINVTTDAYLYVASSDGLSIIDIGNMDALKTLSHFRVLNSENNNLSTPIYGLEVIGNTIYLAATLVGVVAIDITDINVPIERFRIDTNGTTFDLTYTKTYISPDLIHTLHISNYNAKTISYDINSSILTQEDSNNVSGFNYNIGYVTYEGKNTIILAGGTTGVQTKKIDSIDTNYTSQVTASYLSKVQVLNHSNTEPEVYGIVKRLGIVTYDPFSTSKPFTLYQKLPYEATALGYIYDYGILIVADETGKIHGFKK